MSPLDYLRVLAMSEEWLESLPRRYLATVFTVTGVVLLLVLLAALGFWLLRNKHVRRFLPARAFPTDSRANLSIDSPASSSKAKR